jgi:hypothetical protein
MDVCGRLRCYLVEFYGVLVFIWEGNVSVPDMGRARPGLNFHVASSHVSLAGTMDWFVLFSSNGVPGVPGHLLNPWIFKVESFPVSVKPYKSDMWTVDSVFVAYNDFSPLLDIRIPSKFCACHMLSLDLETPVFICCKILFEKRRGPDMRTGKDPVQNSRTTTFLANVQSKFTILDLHRSANHLWVPGLQPRTLPGLPREGSSGSQ